jgi:CRP/FNR family transcriptional regulator, anaerobic regulatory protein
LPQSDVEQIVTFRLSPALFAAHSALFAAHPQSTGDVSSLAFLLASPTRANETRRNRAMYTIAPVAKDSSRFDLTRSVVCRGLSQQAARPLMAISSLHRKAPGEILFAEGDEADSIYEVLRGTVRLYKLLPDGRRLITAFVSAGRLLGLALDDVCVYTAEAITDVTLYRYKRTAFERLVDEVPGLAMRLLAVASDELRTAQERMLLLGRKSATEKVASFLVLMAGQQGSDGVEEVAIPMTRSDIADYLGLTIGTVSRTLTKLIRQGVIAIPTANRIEIRDREDLEHLAAGETDRDL